jgi:hypothetical protein
MSGTIPEPDVSRSRRIARNFVKTYGRSRFALTLDMFERRESGQAVADMLGVSRERVRQWRDTFGDTITLYRVHPEVRALRRPDLGP